MPFSPNRSMVASDVEASVQGFQRAMNSSRYVPTLPAMFRKVSEENRVYIFNVGPWPHVRELGSAGTFRIPACPEGKEHSAAVVIEGVASEPYPKDEVSCVTLPCCGEQGQLTGEGSGFALANQIIGEGPHIPRSSSFVPMGVFVSPTPKPSKEALAAAHTALQKRHLALIREANASFMKDPTNRDNIILPDLHFVAAHALKKTKAECPWLGESVTPGGRADCPGCGEVYNVGILRHSCGWFFDKAKWEANQAGKN